MTHPEPETPQTSQAAERIRTADPFITREIEVPPSAPNPHKNGGSGRREVTRTAGKDTPLDSKPTLRTRRKWSCQNPACDRRGVQIGGGVLKRWCSDRCRKTKYDLECSDCGGRVSGSDPQDLSDTPRCAPCRRKFDHENRHWTPERVIAAILEEAGGDRAPAARDILQGRGKKHRPALVSLAQREFGSWSAAIEAAGLQPRKVGERIDPEAWRRNRYPNLEQTRDEFVRMWRAGVPRADIAAARGSTPEAVSSYATYLRKLGVELPPRNIGRRVTGTDQQEAA